MKDIINSLNLNNFNFLTKQDSSLFYDYIIIKTNHEVSITYRQTNHLLRAFGIVKQRQNEESFEEKGKCSFEKLSYLIDTARNAVPTLNTLKQMAVNLAILGYNEIWLYLEDTFEVNNEPFFGYMRGRYSKKELKELDEYCQSIGIIVIPCIQTLAHLNCIFQWPEYQKCQDINDILLVDSDRTYTLIRHMFETIQECFTTKEVHIGMDEAHYIGRGVFLDKYGYSKPSEILVSHLTKVNQIAKEYGFKTHMWSDMFFRMAFNGGYYTEDGTIPKDIIAKVPTDVGQVYWDYVSDNVKTIKNMFRNHDLFHSEISFAMGGWKWNGYNPSNKFSIYLAKIQLKECVKHDVKRVILTAWSDDGADASIYSTLPTIIYVAENAYKSSLSQEHLNKVSTSLFEFKFKDFLLSDLTLVEKDEEVCHYNYLNYSNMPKILLYNDPLTGIYDSIIKGRFKFRNLKPLSKGLSRAAKSNPKYSSYFLLLKTLVDILSKKATLGIRIYDAYQAKNCQSLDDIANKEIPIIVKKIQQLIKLSHEQWLSENKSNGYSINVTRLGGLIERLMSVKDLLNLYINKKITKIDELEEEKLSFSEEETLCFILWVRYSSIYSHYVR